MFKFKLGRKQLEENEGRRHVHQDFFALHKLCDRGFPSHPSAISYDSQLQLIAIGTQTGEIRIYGQPGFQLSYSLDPSAPIRKIICLNGLARFLVLTIDGSLHLLEMNNSSGLRIDRICTSNEDDQLILQNIQALCLLRDNTSLLIGSNDGNIYIFHLEHLTLDRHPIIPTDLIEKIIAENCTDRLVHPGSVQSIVQHPINDEKILIGYKNTLIVHWDLPSNSHDRTYIYNQEVEAVCWYNQGKNFASCHSNGSYALWDAKQHLNLVETEKTPYGPYPCTPMSKIAVKFMRNGDPLIIFVGGLPRSNYGNKHTVSCLCEKEYTIEGTRHVAFDFTTPVIDFFTIDQVSQDGSRDDPQSLVVLLREEIVIIDLLTDNWPLYHLPYLSSIHASPVICTTLVCNINQEFYQKLVNSAAVQFEEYSDRTWPIAGGEIIGTENNSHEQDLLLTGHEDGSVQFWNVTDVSMPLMYKLKTSDYFQAEQTSTDDTDVETWPPFRKTGLFDPYCDDPRLAIQKLALCTQTETLIVAGTAGQVLTLQFTAAFLDVQINTITVNLLEGCESFVWKGHEELRTKQTHSSTGLGVTSFFQLYPPAAVSALALCPDIQAYAVGTAHGFALINYQQNRILMAKCTLDPNALAVSSTVPLPTGQSVLTRGRSLKKSLRESFRRLRKGRTNKKATISKRIDEENPLTSTNTHFDEIKRLPVERQVESREFKSTDDHIISMVRCLYFAKTYLNSVHDRTRSLWIGTNGGHIYVYSIIGFEAPLVHDATVIVTEQLNACTLAKEIRLKHKAPVLSIIVLDDGNQPVGQGSSIPMIESIHNRSVATNLDYVSSTTVVSHKVLICSEEQFKIFTLPNLKPFCKYKLTATEGSRVRKITINQFPLKTDHINESCLVCLDNMGQLGIYSLPTLRRQILFNCVKASDINALSSLQFSPFARAFYLRSSSEFTELAFSSQIKLPYTMAIAYDKVQRKTIHRLDENKPRPAINRSKDNINESMSIQSDHDNEESISNEANRITLVKNADHSGVSTYSDSAIDSNSGVTSMNDTHPSNDEIRKSMDDHLSSTPLKVINDSCVATSTNHHHQSVSPLSLHKKGPAPPPPPPAKIISVKAHQAPSINEIDCLNSTNKQVSSSTPVMHT